MGKNFFLSIKDRLCLLNIDYCVVCLNVLKFVDDNIGYLNVIENFYSFVSIGFLFVCKSCI